jgi:hypothetical protein
MRPVKLNAACSATNSVAPQDGQFGRQFGRLSPMPGSGAWQAVCMSIVALLDGLTPNTPYLAHGDGAVLRGRDAAMKFS